LTSIDWVRGDSLGLDIPAHAEALRAGGAAFLTQAFHRAGSLPADNRVTHIGECREILGGSTGRKLLLSVEYAHAAPDLHTQLFVKFSRDFDDAVRDQAKVQMELEVWFALLSRSPAFPIAVPACYFSDYHHASGTGILITQRIPYGVDGVEPHYPKCLDYRMPDQLGHYRALIAALGRLAGTYKAGRLPSIVEQYFPFDPDKLVVSKREPYTPEQIDARVRHYIEFATEYPQLLPENIRAPEFFTRFAQEARRFQQQLPSARRVLQSKPDMIALCHWNAHVDNAWFWRANESVECGLMDWGNVSQMNVAMAIWGCLSAAEIFIWDDHFDELLGLFAREFENCGGPALDLAEFKLHVIIYVAMMGLAWMLDVPPYVIAKTPELAAVENRFDARIESNERVRSQLLIMIAFLNLWEKNDMSAVIAYLESFDE